MDAIAAPCRRDFLPAYRSSGQRDTTAIRWVVLHDEEAPTARSAAEYFRSTSSGGSAHLCVDDQTCYRCLDNDVIPWGAASSFGANLHGFHLEMAGYARWSAVIWRSHLNTLRRAAFKTALHCRRFAIPVLFVSAAHLPEQHGITTHAEISAASRRLNPANAARYTHSDPGPFWPRWLFMWLVRRYAAAL